MELEDARERPISAFYLAPQSSLASPIGTRASMDSKGWCIDNVFIERLWRSLKYERVYLQAWEIGSQAEVAIGHLRPHMGVAARCDLLKQN